MNEVDTNAKIIWDYMVMHHEPRPMDAVFALGSNDTRVAERAAELYKEGFGTYVICAGGNGKASDFSRPEAEVFGEIVVERGVPEDKILLETRSTNTGENVQLVKKLIEEKGLLLNSFILVQKPYMERRTYATFKKQWPNAECIVTSPKVSYEEYETEPAKKDRFINVMVGDLLRIKEYPAKEYQIPQEIPDEVWNAYEYLVKLGYTEYTTL